MDHLLISKAYSTIVENYGFLALGDRHFKEWLTKNIEQINSLDEEGKLRLAFIAGYNHGRQDP